MAEQKTLFNDASSLIITGKSKREGLHPLQEEFNSLLLKIAAEEKKQRLLQEQLDAKLEFTLRHITPLLDRMNRMKKEFLELLYGHFKELKISTGRRELLAEYILFFLDQLIFETDILNEEDVDQLEKMRADLETFLYGDAFDSDLTDREEDEMFTDYIKEVQNLRNKEDINVDLSGLRKDMTPSEIEAYLIGQSVKLDLIEMQKEKLQKPRRKTKLQLERESLRKKMEEQKNKSISSIYRQLAKAIHPDLEQDPDKKHQKDELMKELTNAFNQKDLRTLLRLEMEWINKEQNRLDELADDQLKVYITLLKEQLTDLKSSTKQLIYHSRYSAVSYFVDSVSELNAWKPEKELGKLQLQLISNSTIINKLKFNNRECRDQINLLLDEFKKDNLFY